MISPSISIDASDADMPAKNAENDPREGRTGIDRAFDVIRNHTVHTKGYVLTALKLIEEYGTGEDKALLKELLHSKNENLADGTGDTPKRPINRKK